MDQNEFYHLRDNVQEFTQPQRTPLWVLYGQGEYFKTHKWFIGTSALSSVVVRIEDDTWAPFAYDDVFLTEVAARDGAYMSLVAKIKELETTLMNLILKQSELI